MTDMESGVLFANATDRTVKGRLFSWGEESRVSVSGEAPVVFASAADFALPRDVTVLNANIGHDRYKPAARFTAVEDDGVGPVAHFQIADSEEGDELLAGITSGRLTRLSAEVSNLIRKGAKEAMGKLTGAAFVPEGAFASAALFAVGEITTELEVEPRSLEDIAADITALGDPASVLNDLAESLAITDPSETPEANPEEKEDIVTDVIIPEGLAPETPKKKDDSLGALFAAMSYAKKSGDSSVLSPFQGGNVDFAIATVQDSGPSTKTIGLDTAQPAYLGELWSRLTYQRKYWGLVTNAPLTSYKVVGWRWTTRPEVAAYAGNTAEIPSNAVDTEPVSADARRIAGGHRLDRRFRDFNDQEVIESYFRLMTESYAKVSDADILAKIVAAATATTPGTVPTNVPKGLAALVDGALDVVAQDNTPTFAIISPELYRDILFLGKDDTFAYLQWAFGLKGEGDGEGFQIRTGNIGTGKVIVGAKEAITAYELGGSPIRVEAVAPHHGAFDDALYGYIADVVHNAAAIRSITVA
jgi:hypothetical protein